MKAIKHLVKYLRSLMFLLALCPAFLLAEERLEADLISYEDHIKPLLGRYCYDCHDEDVSKGDIRLDNIDPDILKGQRCLFMG